MECENGESSYDEEISLSHDVFKFLQGDHNLLSHIGDKRFFCETCSEGFLEETDLHGHRLEHVGEKPLLICDEPEKEFPELPVLEYPSSTDKDCHRKEKLFHCDICNKRYATRYSFKVHSRRIHSRQIFNSTVKKNHSIKKMFVCKTCRKGFIRSSVLLSHICIQFNEKSFGYSRGPKKDYLRTHYITYSDEKTYSCEICQNKFKREKNLRSHLRMHIGEKPYICDICQKGFFYEGSLIRHRLIHKDEEQSQCENTDGKFSPKSYLDLDTRQTHHTKPSKSYICNYCNASYSEKRLLKHHRNIHNGEKPFTCEVCQKRFRYKGMLNRHIRLH